MTNKTLLSTVVLASMAQFAAAGNAGEQSHQHYSDPMRRYGIFRFGMLRRKVKTRTLIFGRERSAFQPVQNTGRSCPSRAALLTGRYQHEAGMGWMTAVDEHRPGYRGRYLPITRLSPKSSKQTDMRPI